MKRQLRSSHEEQKTTESPKKSSKTEAWTKEEDEYLIEQKKIKVGWKIISKNINKTFNKSKGNRRTTAECKRRLKEIEQADTFSEISQSPCCNSDWNKVENLLLAYTTYVHCGDLKQISASMMEFVRGKKSDQITSHLMEGIENVASMTCEDSINSSAGHGESVECLQNLVNLQILLDSINSTSDGNIADIIQKYHISEASCFKLVAKLTDSSTITTKEDLGEYLENAMEKIRAEFNLKKKGEEKDEDDDFLSEILHAPRQQQPIVRGNNRRGGEAAYIFAFPGGQVRLLIRNNRGMDVALNLNPNLILHHQNS